MHCKQKINDNSFSTTFAKSITFNSSTEHNMVDIKAHFSLNRQNKAVLLIHPINALIKSIHQETTRQDTPKKF